MLLSEIPSPANNILTIGDFNIYYYGILVASGILAACILSAIILKVRGYKASLIVDLAIFAVPFGVVGARFWHVATHWKDYKYEPISALYIWEGGIGIFGALVFGGIGLLLACKVYKIHFFVLADIVVPGVVLAQAIGRVGNYFNEELYGTPTDLPWGLALSVTPSNIFGLSSETLYHPVFLYESLWCLLICVILLIAMKRFQNGMIFGLYLTLYSLGRFFFEEIRLDYANIVFGMRVNQLLALIGIAAGIVIIRRCYLSHPTRSLMLFKIALPDEFNKHSDKTEGDKSKTLKTKQQKTPKAAVAKPGA